MSRDLEKEFDPTQWSKRITDPKELLKNHVALGNTGELCVAQISEISEISDCQFPTAIVMQSSAC